MSEGQTNGQSASNNTGKILGVATAVVVVGAVAASALRTKAPTTNEPMNTTSTNTGTSSTSTMTSYKDGSYKADGMYRSPAGEEKVTIDVTLANGVITKTEFTGYATNPASVNRQGAFKQGFEKEVIGKKIDEVSLGVVNGSSLTPKGFMEALNKIKAEAKS